MEWSSGIGFDSESDVKPLERLSRGITCSNLYHSAYCLRINYCEVRIASERPVRKLCINLGEYDSLQAGIEPQEVVRSDQGFLEGRAKRIF